jgi:hypothetical protein
MNHRIAEVEKWKTAIYTCYYLLEFLVIPFGLTNAPVIFQNFINDILAPSIDRFCKVYLDDILLYSAIFEEYQQHINLVLEAFEKAGLYLKLEKCEFHHYKVKDLGLIISTEGIKRDLEKIITIQNCEAPYNLKNIYAFLGFANFYYHFVWNDLKIVQPVTLLT